MKSRISIQILKGLLSSCFAVLIVYNGVVYVTCKRELSNNKPILYTVKEKKEHKGKGNYYTMAVIYKAKVYEVDVTNKTYTAVDEQEYPILFHNQLLDIVFEKWKLSQAKRLMGVGVIMLMVVVLFIKSPKNKYS